MKKRLINEINNLDTGDYYFFGHSSEGKKYTGSTKAATNTVQVVKFTLQIILFAT